MKPCAPSPTGWSATFTAAYDGTAAMTNPSPGRRPWPRPLDFLDPWDVPRLYRVLPGPCVGEGLGSALEGDSSVAARVRSAYQPPIRSDLDQLDAREVAVVAHRPLSNGEAQLSQR